MIATTVLGRALRGWAVGRRVAAGGVLILGATSLVAQTPQGEAVKEPKPFTPPPIFKEEQPMEFTLTAPFKLASIFEN